MILQSSAINTVVKITQVEVFVFRAPIETPVKTSFGTMSDRPSVLVRVEDEDGFFGWGEIWCNFPLCGAEHRARLVKDVLAPLLFDQPISHPRDNFYRLTNQTHILGIQSGEPGPIAQAIAGVDIAIWDLVARREQIPLYRLFHASPISSVPAYASGIHPDFAIETISLARNEGFSFFKVKVGFDLEGDPRMVADIIDCLDDSEGLMVDANQGWDPRQAAHFIEKANAISLKWIEEPIAADSPETAWCELAASTAIPLAAGENVRGIEGFSHLIAAGYVRVVQPDACKWGGVTGTLTVAQRTLRAGLCYCPHYLGGGIGLVASAHILAAAGGDGLLEIDVNPNPLRGCLAKPYPVIEAGNFLLPDTPGLGVEPDMDDARRFLVASYLSESNSKSYSPRYPGRIIAS
jgi:D-galactarolactone cycloisomerase